MGEKKHRGILLEVPWVLPKDMGVTLVKGQRVGEQERCETEEER